MQIQITHIKNTGFAPFNFCFIFNINFEIFGNKIEFGTTLIETTTFS